MTAFALDHIDRLLTTTKAVRRRLDLSRPVDREAVAECVARASYAPQPLQPPVVEMLVVDAPALRAEIGEDYRRMTVPAVTSLRDAKLAEGDNAGVRISELVLYLAVKMGQVPVLVIPCIQGSPTSRLADQAAMFGSIYPAVWSFQLALSQPRARFGAHHGTPSRPSAHRRAAWHPVHPPPDVLDPGSPYNWGRVQTVVAKPSRFDDEMELLVVARQTPSPSLADAGAQGAAEGHRARSAPRAPLRCLGHRSPPSREGRTSPLPLVDEHISPADVPAVHDEMTAFEGHRTA
jgi:hypothetical protein